MIGEGSGIFARLKVREDIGFGQRRVQRQFQRLAEIVAALHRETHVGHSGDSAETAGH